MRKAIRISHDELMWHVPLSLALLEMAGQIVDAQEKEKDGKGSGFDLDLDDLMS